MQENSDVERGSTVTLNKYNGNYKTEIYSYIEKNIYR